MRVDVVETDTEYRLLADLPGAAIRDITVDVDANNVLSIVAEKSDSFDSDMTSGGITLHRAERTTGRLWRNVQLPSFVDGGQVSARLEAGVLVIVARKNADAPPHGRRHIAVAAGAPRVRDAMDA